MSRPRHFGKRAALAVVIQMLCTAVARAATEATPPSTSGALLQGLLGLAMVLVVLAGFFWFLRRFSPGQTAAQGAVKVVGGVMLGPRERLVVVEVGDTWLLLGVGGGQINALHTLPRPAGYVPPETSLRPGGMPDFADKLRSLMAKRQP